MVYFGGVSGVDEKGPLLTFCKLLLQASWYCTVDGE